MFRTKSMFVFAYNQIREKNKTKKATRVQHSTDPEEDTVPVIFVCVEVKQ